jgi:hypothetical protein
MFFDAFFQRQEGNQPSIQPRSFVPDRNIHGASAVPLASHHRTDAAIHKGALEKPVKAFFTYSIRFIRSGTD